MRKFFLALFIYNLLIVFPNASAELDSKCVRSSQGLEMSGVSISQKQISHRQIEAVVLGLSDRWQLSESSKFRGVRGSHGKFLRGVHGKRDRLQRKARAEITSEAASSSQNISAVVETPAAKSQVIRPLEPSSSDLFSPTSFWNTPLAADTPVATNSTGLVQELVTNTKLAPTWFNTIGYSTPLYIVDDTATVLPVSIVQNGQVLDWTSLNEVLQKGVPIPAGANAAPGDDGHITIWDKANDRLYEFWQFRMENNSWVASWGGVIDNVSTSSGVMPTVTNKAGGPEKWGATATGLPMIGGTVLLDELARGVIDHALAIAIQRPAASEYVWPAQRTDGFYTGPNAISEGQRFRFLDTIEIDPNWSPLIKMIVAAVRDYGLVVRDKGVGISFYGEDPAVYGLSESAYTPYMNGLPLWEVMPQFPWDKLVAVL